MSTPPGPTPPPGGYGGAYGSTGPADSSGGGSYGEPTAPVQQVCYRHPDRAAGVRCQRCDRPICGACMTPASVGFQCPECHRAGSREIRRPNPVRSSVIRLRGTALSYVLIGINVAVFVVVNLLGLIPATTLAMFGPLVGSQPWRLLTSIFVHQGWLHIGANMFMLWQLGPALEALVGRVRFLVIYLASGLGGSLLVWVIAPHTVTVGASGAILGLVGALLVVVRSRGGSIGFIAFYLLLTAYISVTQPGISWQGHLGGAVTGALLGLIFVGWSRRRRRPGGSLVNRI